MSTAWQCHNLAVDFCRQRRIAGREAKGRKARLSSEFQDLRYIESGRLEEISPNDVAEATFFH